MTARQPFLFVLLAGKPARNAEAGIATPQDFFVW